MNYKELLTRVTTFVFDYDGVLTDGTILIDRDGELLRTANVRDGYAIRQAVNKGYRVAIISGGRTESVRKRFEVLGVNDVFLGVSNKLSVFQQFLTENQLQPEEVLFMGDDIPDFELMQAAGVATCPSDASEEIKSAAMYISAFPGGRGCARDVIEQVMRVQNKWFDQTALSWDV
jgi:3-deoxy-D-manno-octulosonate 8-phosphate phosphatase (KDO 8-P phosphatase)